MSLSVTLQGGRKLCDIYKVGDDYKVNNPLYSYAEHVTAIEASGEELLEIETKCGNLPTIYGLFGPTNEKSVVFFGDHAKFIMANVFGMNG